MKRQVGRRHHRTPALVAAIDEGRAGSFYHVLFKALFYRTQIHIDRHEVGAIVCSMITSAGTFILT